MFEDEEWLEVEKLPHYMVSNCGRIKHVNTIEARKVSISDRGFPCVTLYGADSKTRYYWQVNKIVAEAFLHPAHYANQTAVWHIDGRLGNCRADNLRWDTRSRVLAWNEMNRLGKPKLVTAKVKNNRTGVIYENAYECGLAEGELEETIVWKVERQGRSMTDDNARYRYIFEPDDRR